MIRTQPLRAKGKVELAFVLPEPPPGTVFVVGDFNDWDTTRTPMTPGGEGYEARVTVDAGRRYAFRYLREDGAWFNDDSADTYEPGPFGEYNGVVDVPAPPAPARKPRAKAAANGDGNGAGDPKATTRKRKPAEE